VAFHVEIRRAFSRAWAFNLEEAELRRIVLEPWVRGDPVLLGEQRWEPSSCRIAVLEGPRLAAAELAHGQGWHRASRSGRDVTGELLRPGEPTGATVVALVTHDEPSRRAVGAAVGALGLTAIDFAAVRARLLARPPASPGAAAAIVVIGSGARSSDWALDAGLALGALGERAVVVCVGDQPAPDELAAVRALRLPQGGREAALALAGPLRAAGCAVRPVAA
jgi:hypothetical protein